MLFVLDASVTMAWRFEDEKTEFTQTLLLNMDKGYQAYVPQIWHMEVANVLLMSEKRGRIAKPSIDAFLIHLQSLPITTDPSLSRVTTTEILNIARKHKLTVYDAYYLELAIRMNAPLATLDRALQQAAQQNTLPALSV